MTRAVLALLLWPAVSPAVTAGDPFLSAGASAVRGTFLLRGVGARPVGMGEAFTAVADDASAATWNPGGLAQVESLNALAMYDAVGREIGLGYVAGAAPAGVGVAAASLTAMSYGDYETFDALGNRTGTAGLLDLGATVAWSVEHPAWLPVGGGSGVSVEWVRETVGDAFVGFGAGTLIPLGPDTSAGAALLHLGTKRDGASLPALARIGVTHRLPARVRAAADGVFGLVDERRWITVGGEWAPSARIALRAGWKQDLGDRGAGGFRGLTAGMGMMLSGCAVDYAYQPEGDLGTSHRVSIGFGRRAAGEE